MFENEHAAFDAQIIEERDRQIAVLTGLAAILGQLAIIDKQLTDVLPIVVNIDDIVHRVRQFGVPVPGALS